MGQIEINHTGSGGGVVLSSDGTNLLLGGSAIGGGADLYTANESSPDAQPSATGTNAVAIGDSSEASGTRSTALGKGIAAAIESAAIGPAYAGGASSFAAGISTNGNSYGASAGSSVAIGNQAQAVSTYACAVGGLNNRAGATYATAIGGSNAIASGSYAIVLGGLYNTASGENSVASGSRSLAAIYGKKAHASGRFNSNGDAQGCMYVLRSDTTDATAEAMTTNNGTASATNQIVAATDTCIMFSGTIVAMQNGAQDQGGWEIKGLLKNDGGTTTLVNSQVNTFDTGNGWDISLSADDTNNALKVQCTGEASHNIRWVANIQTSEVTYA